MQVTSSSKNGHGCRLSTEYRELRESLLSFYDDTREQRYDRYSAVIAYKSVKDELVGGIRMIVSRVGNEKPLPLEKITNMRLANLFSCGLKMISYAEAGGIVVHPDYEGREIASLLYFQLLEEAIDEKVKYIFSLAERGTANKLARLPFTSVMNPEIVTGCPYLSRKAGKDSVLVCIDTHNLLEYFRRENES